jgi:Na+-transporting NADH:ubiquinone oxidoreductase subunit NqrE
MVVGNTILNGAGMPGRAMIVVLSTLAAVAGGVTLFIYQAGPNDSALTAAATGSALGMTFGMILSGVIVYRKLGAFIPLGSAVRIAVASGIASVVGRLLPVSSKVMTLVECGAVFLLYFIVLIAIREFKKQDLAQLKRVLSRKK